MSMAWQSEMNVNSGWLDAINNNTNSWHTLKFLQFESKVRVDELGKLVDVKEWLGYAETSPS